MVTLIITLNMAKMVKDVEGGKVMVDYFWKVDGDSYYSNRMLFRNSDQAAAYERDIVFAVKAGSTARSTMPTAELDTIKRAINNIKFKWGTANMQPKIRDYFWRVQDYSNEQRVEFDLPGRSGGLDELIAQSKYETRCADVTQNRV